MTKAELMAKIDELVLADREAQRLGRGPKSDGWQVVVDAEVKVEMLKKEIERQVDVMYQGAADGEAFYDAEADCDRCSYCGEPIEWDELSLMHKHGLCIS